MRSSSSIYNYSTASMPIRPRSSTSSTSVWVLHNLHLSSSLLLLLLLAKTIRKCGPKPSCGLLSRRRLNDRVRAILGFERDCVAWWRRGSLRVRRGY